MSVLDNHCGHPKHDYIGNPVKHVALSCPQCGKHYNDCTCGHSHGCGSNCGTTIVVDDANDVLYIYGNIIHENYHVPTNECTAWTAAASAGFNAKSLQDADEYFEGVQDQNTVTIKHNPQKDNSFLVFLNGVKQREGEEQDYVLNGRDIHFNFYELLETDLVEVMYKYGTEA